MGKYKLLLLFLILVIGFAARLYRFDGPIADWHSWRQADTSSVSRNFVNSGFNLLYPTFHDLSNVPSNMNNPNGYRFVEFPIYNLFQAGFHKLFGIFTLEQWGRLVTIFSSLSSVTLIYLILKRHQNEVAGLIGAFFFSVLPFSVYYGRTVLADTSTAAAILAGIYFFDLWIGSYKEKNLRKVLFFLVSLSFTAVALLLKPFAIIFAIPMVYLSFKNFGFKAFINPWLWLFAAVTISPLAGWRIWMAQFPEGIPGNNWLFNDGNIRFKPSFFYWIFAERVGKLILGYWGVALFILGLINKIKKDGLFLYAFLLSSILYLVIIAKGNVQHDYYQILILPTICIFLGLGGEFLVNQAKNFSNKYAGFLILAIVSIFTGIFSWYYIRDFFNINNPSIIVAGEAVDRLTPKDAKVIANYNGDTTFLYHTKRSGWASYQHELHRMKGELGADFLAIVNPVPSDFIYAKDYYIVEQTSQYAIFDLNKNP